MTIEEIVATMDSDQRAVVALLADAVVRVDACHEKVTELGPIRARVDGEICQRLASAAFGGVTKAEDPTTRGGRVGRQRRMRMGTKLWNQAAGDPK